MLEHEIVIEFNICLKCPLFSKQSFECIYIEFHCDNDYHVLPCELSVLQFDKRIIKLSFFTLKMASNIITDDDIYKMTSNPRGFCVIFNMLNFDGNSQLDRSDSIKSVSLVQDTFERLQFDVKIYQDLSGEQLKNKLREYVNKEECKLHDCFVLYIHSHGKENGFITANMEKIGFITANMEKIGFNEIMEMLCNKNC